MVKKRKKGRWIITAVAVVGAVFIFLVVFSNLWITVKTRSRIFSDFSRLPDNDIGLLLGTSKFLRSGRKNYYYHYRLAAAAELYFRGKIRFILASGDNSHMSYNEPAAMKRDLIAMGVPPEAVVLDYAGFRTLDSVLRARLVFKQSSFTIISQKFHNRRAVFIAMTNSIGAVAYNARDVRLRAGFKVRVREWFARFMAFLDVYVFRRQPKFLGEEISIL
ncbi:MAG: vancomycin high temperature exclusion protein [Spirochaetales bacterium]|nr:MAG: vancomycin high temperature exclusion protein [Spirochaetales bacterium]